MTTSERPRSTTLARHFFSALFDFGWLSDAGTMSFTRLVIGVCAVLPPAGLLLLRIFAGKYILLSDDATPLAYREAVVADHAFLIGIPMWIVAFVTILIAHAVFPDERDFRILMPLPIERRTVFGAKLLALTWFVGLFTLATHVALLPLLGLIAMNRWASGAFLTQLAAHEAASVLGTIFTAVTIIAAQGIVTTLPWGRAATRTSLFRSLAIGGLVLVLPVLSRLPALARAFADGAAWLFVIPPFWFAGLEHMWLGELRPYTLAHAGVGLALTAVVTVISGGAYAFLYARFDRVIRPASGPVFSPRRGNIRVRSRMTAFYAVRRFTTLTLQRSALHQGAMVSIAAVGIGIVANTFIGAGLIPWLTAQPVNHRALINAAVWAPFALIFVASMAVRTTLALPIEPRANWIFRMTEQDESRPALLGAPLSTLRWIGAIAPVALMLPIQMALVGPRALAMAGVALLSGALLQELLMREWLRVPFAAAYVPGKRFVPQMILGGWAAFAAFTAVGAGLAALTSIGVGPAIGIDVLIAGIVWLMRRRRLSLWQSTPLSFDDALPDEIYSFRIGRD